MKNCLLLSFLFGAYLAGAQPGLTTARMHEIFQQKTEVVEHSGGIWQLALTGRGLLVVTDTAANRMRIFTPIVAQEELSPGQLEIMLAANFHSALDAKYAIYEGHVVSVFTHPLRELTEAQLLDALQQVASLANTFGTSYQSGELIFGGSQNEAAPPRLNQSPRPGKKN